MFTDSSIVFALVYWVARYSLLFRLRINITKCVLFIRVKTDILLKDKGDSFLQTLTLPQKLQCCSLCCETKKVPAVLAFFSFSCKSNLKNVDGDLKAALYFH